MFLSSQRQAGRFGAIALIAGAFAIGFGTGSVLPRFGQRAEDPVHTGALGTPRESPAAPVPAAPPNLRTGYPAEVLRVLDGDTFEARVRIWPGHDVTTRVRLRGIDAPEMKARCEDERARAVAARTALMQMLEQGNVAISAVGLDKYGGRVDAEVSTARTADVGRALRDAGHARDYAGGRRQSWCEASR
ncbi:MAG: thermonuclease family protein [Pseudolabrys sp.]|nr:thermonuclease family protein [Pseudolabrys sp.]